MRLTIFVAGSRGDVQPGVALGKGLHQAGFEVGLAAPQNFAGLIQEEGLRFHPLRGDIQQIMAGEAGQKFMETNGVNPVQSILAMRAMLASIAMPLAEDVLEACRHTEALISMAVLAPFAKTVAEIHRIPLLNFEPTPVLPTGDFPAPGWPLQKNLGRALNRFSGAMMLWVIWQWYSPSVNALRQRFELKPLKSFDFQRLLATTPLLGAYSPTVIPPPPDWPKCAHITGYWFQDEQSNWQPPKPLQAFLDSGPPPVYVGFGSMAGCNPEHFTQIVLEALAQTGQRALLLTGWGGLKMVKMPDNVFVLDSAPHGWLFPQMAAVVHHGGAGTTGEGLRAGKPTVIIPFIVDQSFWGARVHTLGAGPQPIPAKQLAAEKLANAIQTATQDSTIKHQAQTIGQAIRAEDGLNNAVKFIQRYLRV